MKKNVCKWLSAALAVVMTVALLPMGGLVSAATNSMPVTTNLVSNGDFELLKSGEATYWHGGAVTADAAHAGNYGACVGVEENDGGQVYTTIAVDQGCSYLLTFYAKVNAGTLVARITGDTSGESYLNEYCNNATWELYSFIINVSGADESAKLTFRSLDNAEFYVDDVILVLSGATSKTALSNGGFENGNASGWASKSSSEKISANAAAAHAGDYGALVPSRGVTFTAYQQVAVEANTDYTISFWYKSCYTSAVAEEVRNMCFNVYSAIGGDPRASTAIGTAVTLDYKQTEWTQVTLSFNSGSYTSVYLAFGSTSSSGQFNFLYVDEIAMIATSAGGDSTPDVTNLISNSTFETGVVSPWKKFGTSSATPSVVSDYVHTGSYSLCVPFSVRQLSCGQDVAVEANTDYIVSFYYMSADTSAGKNMWFGAYTTDITSCTSSKNDLALDPVVLDYTNSEWTLATYSFNSGDNTTVRLSFSGTSSLNPSNRYFIRVDDIVMVKQFTSFPEESIKGTYYTATGSYAGINKQVFPAEEGKTYRISFSTRAMTNGFRLRVNNYSDNSMFYAETNRAWKDVTLTYRTETDNLTLELVNLSTEHLETNFYITDYVIEEIPDDEVNIFTYDGKSAMEMNGNLANEEDGKGGLAFKYTVAMNNAVVAAGNHSVEGSAGMIYQQNSAIAHPFTNDEYSTPYDYKVVEVGTIVSREYSNMDDLTLDNVNGSKTIQIKGEKRWDVGADYYSYVVRVRNIPEAFWGDEIYVRAYAIVETANGTRQVTLYDNIMAHGNYDATIQGNVPQPE